MKTNILAFVASVAALAASSPAVCAQQTASGQTQTPAEDTVRSSPVTFDQLPRPVQSTILGQAGTAPVQSIQEIDINGGTRYLVMFSRNAQPIRLQVDPNGRVVNGSELPFASPPRTELAAVSKVSFDLLPSAVQETLRQYAMHAPIQDIDKGTVQGQTVYQASFQHNNQNVVLQVAQNGGLIPDAVNDNYLASIGMVPGWRSPADVSPIAVPDWRTAPIRKPLAQSSPVSFRSLPQAVRDSLSKYANGATVGSIQEGTVDGRQVYQAELLPSDQKIELRLSDSGAVLNDQVNDRFLSDLAGQATRTSAVGQAPGSQSLSGSAASNAGSPAKVPLDEVPLAVRATVTAQASGAPIDSIIQSTIDGRTVYDATFDQGGQQVKVRVADDGSVLGAQTPAR